MACLFKFLPFLIGDKIPANNKHWSLYLSLSKIVDIVYTDDITLGNLGELNWLVEEHHFLFKELFSDVNLKKKHHNMVHYANALRELGNMLDYVSLRFESKHTQTKRAAQTIHNTTNLLFSVTKRMQILSFYNLLLNKQLNLKEDILSSKECEYESLDGEIKCLISNNIECLNKNSILNSVSFKFYGQVIKKGMLLTIKNSNKNNEREIKIAEILDVVILNDKVYLYCVLYEISNYDEHLHAHVINKTNSKILLTVDSVYHHHPFNIMQSLDINETKLFIRTNFIF